MKTRIGRDELMGARRSPDCAGASRGEGRRRGATTAATMVRKGNETVEEDDELSLHVSFLWFCPTSRCHVYGPRKEYRIPSLEEN